LTIKSAQQTPQARVFISCGQRSEEEKQLGFACRDYLKSRNFLTYLAEDVQRLEALTENIFHHLRDSEYAVFIDCKREELRPREFRGSIFVNQELAIASFLPITESRVFHETGVIREGVADSLIAKPIHFSNKQEFFTKLEEETKNWHSDWRNELFLDFYRVVPNVDLQDGRFADWYHLKVVNKHISKYARNCVAYVLQIIDLVAGHEINVGNFELVWAGTGMFERHILPKKQAEIDAFLVIRGEQVIRFHHRPSTSSEYGMPLLKKGNYLITYMLISENFEQVIKTFRLEFGGDFQQVKFSTV
jgi:hypothetical protein